MRDLFSLQKTKRQLSDGGNSNLLQKYDAVSEGVFYLWHFIV